MRLIVWLIAGLCALGAAALAALGLGSAALGLAGWAVLLAVALVIERWRYQKLGGGPPGPGWQATGERFVDPETGRLITVYFHPSSGERRYIAAQPGSARATER